MESSLVVMCNKKKEWNNERLGIVSVKKNRDFFLNKTSYNRSIVVRPLWQKCAEWNTEKKSSIFYVFTKTYVGRHCLKTFCIVYTFCVRNQMRNKYKYINTNSEYNYYWMYLHTLYNVMTIHTGEATTLYTEIYITRCRISLFIFLCIGLYR